MSYTYTCDCKSKPCAPVLKAILHKDGVCIHCGHYAYLTQVKSGRVWTKPMKEAMPKHTDGRYTFNEDWN